MPDCRSGDEGSIPFGPAKEVYMTLYRIKDEQVEVLLDGEWKTLDGDRETILDPVLTPRSVGEDTIYEYIVTNEP